MIQPLGAGQLTHATTLDRLTVKRRHWTMDLVEDTRLEAHPLCHLCDQAEEAYDDLGFGSSFVQAWLLCPNTDDGSRMCFPA